MFVTIQGRPRAVLEDGVVLQCEFVSYFIRIPRRTAALIDSEKLCLFWTQVFYFGERMLEAVIYGFQTSEELRIFNSLRMLQGIGPSAAMRIMEHEPSDLFAAIRDKNIKFLTSVPHIGKVLAKKIIDGFEVPTDVDKGNSPDMGKREVLIKAACHLWKWTKKKAIIYIDSAKFDYGKSEEKLVTEMLQKGVEWNKK